MIVSAFIFAIWLLTKSPWLVYGLFFSISFTSLFGFTETLTGSHATSTNLIFYGLAFYTAYFAYHIQRNNLTGNNILIGANPLLLVTGPISTFFKSHAHKQFRKRLAYYLPFIVIGIFLFKVIATPLTEFFSMIELTDLASALTFAVIFELFVYANFAGLSLMIYGLFGIAGVKIPLNFRQPFSARNLIDFWKGWHVSLSIVLKAVFYEPVKRKLNFSRFSTQLAILVVFLASAFWHGVTFNFLIWGLLHGLLFVLTLYLLKRKKVLFMVPVLLVMGVVIGRMVFADSDTARLIEKLMFSWDANTEVLTHMLSVPKAALIALFLGLMLMFVEFAFLRNRHVAKRNYKFLRVPFSQMVMIGLFVLLVSTSVGLDYAVYGQR
nr:MBOAT family O-acyltransferase [Thiomicrospira sp. ALE5]